MVITTDLNELAAATGATIGEHRGGEKGRYYGSGRITIRHGLGPINYKCTLAHELGHHILRHSPTATGWIRERQERQADRFAARLLIPATEYELAEHLYGPHPGAIAAELGVTVHLLEVWRTLNERIHS